MDWDALYIAAKNPRIRPVSHDWFHVSPSLSSPQATEMNSQTLAALSFFTEPKTMHEAYERLGETLDASEEEFGGAFSGIVDAGLLIEVTRDAPEPGGADESDVRLKIAEATDTSKALGFRAALAKLAPGKVVASIGCGCGVIPALAAKAGARAVYAVEESDAIGLAEQLAGANGVSDKMSFIHGASTEIELPDPAEVLVVEWPGADPLRHHVLAILADARERLLADDARILPGRVDFQCVAVEDADYPMSDALEPAGERLGLKFDPLYEAYAGGGDLIVRESAAPADLSKALSKPVLLLSLDLESGEEPGDEGAEVELEIVRTGVCAGFVVAVEAHLDGPTPLGSIRYSLPRPVAVEAGGTISVFATAASGLRLSLPDEE